MGEGGQHHNNPIRYRDADGRIPLDTIWDAANVIYDVVLCQNRNEANQATSR
jgi:hypothetical protein